MSRKVKLLSRVEGNWSSGTAKPVDNDPDNSFIKTMEVKEFHKPPKAVANVGVGINCVDKTVKGDFILSNGQSLDIDSAELEAMLLRIGDMEISADIVVENKDGCFCGDGILFTPENEVDEMSQSDIKLKKWWKNKEKRYKPVIKPLLKQERTLKVVQGLISLECDEATVDIEDVKCSIEKPSFADVKNKKILLRFEEGETERFKKIVAMHEASHLSQTPDPTDLTWEDQSFIANNKILINILEDSRVNRYLSLKYKSLIRYFASEIEDTDNFLLSASLGDLLNIPVNPVINPEIQFLEDYVEDIRKMITFKDVLSLARKIIEDQELQDSEPSQGSDDAGDNSPDDDSGVNGASDTSGDSQNDSAFEKRIEDKIGKQLEDYIDNISDSKLKQVFKPDDMSGNGFLGFDGEKTLPIHKEDVFLGDSPLESGYIEKIKPQIMNKLRKLIDHRNTREGKLGKLNISRLMNDGKVFHRRTSNRQGRKAYIVLDGSGSMNSHSRKWQKTLSKSLVKSLMDLSVDCRLFIHSGDSIKFIYDEISYEDIDRTHSHIYTLDGSMLEALFTREINFTEKPIIFYFSDGHIPAQYPHEQERLLNKYLSIGANMGVPVFGIGLNATGVKLFEHYYIVKDVKDFQGVLDSIGDELRFYL